MKKHTQKKISIRHRQTDTSISFAYLVPGGKIHNELPYPLPQVPKLILTKNSEPICSDARKAQVLAESFEVKLNTSPPRNDPTSTATVEATIRKFLFKHSNKLVTFSALHQWIRNIF